MHGDVAASCSRASRRAATKTPVPPIWDSEPREDVAVGADVDQLHGEPADGGQLVRGLLRLGQGQFAGAGADPDAHGAS